MAIITFSRQVAALGDEIAVATAQKLGYRFIGRKELEEKIVELGFPQSKLPKYDERKPGFFASLAKDRDEYLDYLQTAILESISEGNCVLIGRGAFVILQQVPNVISIRLVSDDNIRMDRLKKEFNWDDKAAKKRIEESDENRRGFHKSFFNIDNEDSSHYHMVLNSGLMDAQSITELISQTIKTAVTPEKEEAGKKKIGELLLAQKLVNTLVFEYKLNINFLQATIKDKTVLLHGVADSSPIIQKVISIASRELPDYKIESAISVVQDFRTKM